jgi:hypothetical protein
MTPGPGHRHQTGHSLAPGALPPARGGACGIGPERGTRAAVRGDAALSAGVRDGRGHGGGA